jgi:DHA2 family multidrug resistance protein-like MFS transporter
VLAWVALSGLGFGLVMPSAMNVALGSLSAERSGAGLGPAHGHAPGRLDDRGGHPRHGDQQQLQQPGGHHRASRQAAAAVRSSVGSGVAVAVRARLGLPADSVRGAFVDGMDIMLWTCGGIAVGCACSP